MSQSRRGAETGGGFQSLLNRIHEVYEREGRACITRKAIPGKFLARKGGAGRWEEALPGRSSWAGGDRLPIGALQVSSQRGEGRDDRRQFVPEAKAEPDYGGTLAPSGRAIYFDAKTTRREALDFDNLHAHQVDYLHRTARFGAVAGFLVEFSRHQLVYFLPIQLLILWREQATRKSLPYSFFAECLVPAPAGKGFLLFDYLAAIEEQEARYGLQCTTFSLPDNWVLCRRGDSSVR
jgi:penicillin-binding protein-related factor A (putative recombinase)